MKPFKFVSLLLDLKSKSGHCSILMIALLICGSYFISNAILSKDFGIMMSSLGGKMNHTRQNTQSNSECKKQCRAVGSEALPEGIIAQTSNLEMRPLWGPVAKNNNSTSANLLAIAAGIKQKETANQIVEKFMENGFSVMVFHYDGVVDEWRDVEWSSRVIHVSAINQTKWWFAKRFLHPDIVAEYDYIFLWDEDLDVHDFDPGRYLSIVKEEGLEISQPALGPGKVRVHHQITVRLMNSKVHRRFYKNGGGRCDDDSTAPPCVGWVEIMAPVFSRAAWRCTWYMIQNDLIHAWGLDMQLGYCAQGDRTKNIGVVDSEFVVHLGLPTLGVSDGNKDLHRVDARIEVRKQSVFEMQTFKSRWNNAVEEDKCWVDPYPKPANQTTH